jgi:hypothetical protein
MIRALIIVLLTATSLVAQGYELSVRGPRHAWSGGEHWVTLKTTFTDGMEPEYLYFDSVIAPGPYELHCTRFGDRCGLRFGRPAQYRANNVMIRLLPQGLTPGTHRITITTELRQIKRTISYDVEILQPTLTVTPLAFTPPLDKTKWEHLMVTLGHKWCNPTQIYSFGVESEVWYYDGARVFFNVADYTGDKAFEACALNIARQYSAYVQNPTGVMGSRTFPHGLMEAYRRTGDPAFRDGVEALVKKGSWRHTGGTIDEGGIRETSFMLQAYLAAQELGISLDDVSVNAHTFLQRNVEWLLGHYNILFRTKDYDLNQTFFNGLAAEALIEYYERSRDPRIPAAIKLMLDWTWEQCWTGTSLITNPEPVGPKCEWGCQTGTRDLINLTAHAYAWYYMISGDVTYQQRGDEMWRYALETDISYNGKIFAQNYRDSLNYVKWREFHGPLRFVPVSPCRVVDTRLAAGPLEGPIMKAQQARSFPLATGNCGIPADALAYALNATVVPVGPLGYLTMWPTGSEQPLVSTLNSLDGRIKANAAIVAAGAGGSINAFVTDAAHLILDVNGYFVNAATAPTALQYYPLTPCRLVDTRLPGGPLGSPSMGASQKRDFPVRAGSCGVPSNASAYSLNVTAVPHGPLAYLTLWPAGESQPHVSTLNAFTGTITANAAVVRAGVDSSISVYSSNATDLVVDINGYFAPPGIGGLSLYRMTPCRLVDTRRTVESLGGPSLSGERKFPVEQSKCALPKEAKALSLNVTTVPLPRLGFLTIWPSGSGRPLVSTLNALDGAITSNGAWIGIGAGGISAFSSDETHVIIDAGGYFAP